MFEFTMTIHWITLIIGFVAGSSAALFGILLFTAVVEKNCTCPAWKVDPQ